jgi:uncharacterized membrane protein
MSRSVLFACLFFGACTSASSTGIDISTLECPPDSTLTYETFGAPAIEHHCLSCHATKERPTLVTLDQVRANKQSILSAAVASTSMPEGSDMLLEERELLGEWLACGAP